MKFWKSILAGLMGAALSAGALAEKTTLTVYTALETDQLKAYQAAFNQANPDIEPAFRRGTQAVEKIARLVIVLTRGSSRF